MTKKFHIDAAGMHYTPLNQKIRVAVENGATEITLDHINGQRFIGNGLRGDDVTLIINGVPGGDLGMFMSGPTCIVHANADHAPGNTMDYGRIYIHGDAGDAVAHSMRGGSVYVKGDIGYRGGIHMKEYEDKRPILVVGGNARAFLGEYMAGAMKTVSTNGVSEPAYTEAKSMSVAKFPITIWALVQPKNPLVRKSRHSSALISKNTAGPSAWTSQISSPTPIPESDRRVPVPLPGNIPGSECT